MQQFRFDNPVAHWWQETQLADLAVALAGLDNLQVVYGPYSFLNIDKRTLAISTFWESLDEIERLRIQKADVYLRAVGNLNDTNWSLIQSYWNHFAGTHVHHFFQQLLCIVEDARLKRTVTRSRPGTKLALDLREEKYAEYLRRNRTARLREGRNLDVLLTDIYLQLAGQSPVPDVPVLGEPVESLQSWLGRVPTFAFVEGVHSASDTQAGAMAAAAFAEQILESTEGIELKDVLYRLFTFDVQGMNATSEEKKPSVTSKPASREEQQALKEGKPDDTSRREDVEVWTQEQENEAGGGFAMEIESSEGSPSANEQARMGQDHPQSVVTRRGHSDTGTYEDHGETDQESRISPGVSAKRNETDPVQVKHVPRHPVTQEAREHVREWDRETQTTQRKLLRLFDQMMLHQMQARQLQTRHGHLDKRLTRLVTDAFPRPFYHKSSHDKPFDAAVQLLIDCSGSMYSRLEPLKPLIYLFHETLRKARIAHDICGFWEDTLSTAIRDEAKPVTHLLHVVEWGDGWNRDVAGHIDELEAQLDNRDGFAIRQVGQQLVERVERQKWLVVLSDGEPAAQDYRDAILDTKNAIRELTAKDVQVLHICLADGPEASSIETMKQMYGHRAMIVKQLSDLPAVFERTLSTMMRRAAL